MIERGFASAAVDFDKYGYADYFLHAGFCLYDGLSYFSHTPIVAENSNFIRINAKKFEYVFGETEECYVRF